MFKVGFAAKVTVGVVVTGSLAAGATYVAVRDTATPAPCEAHMTIRMTPIVASAGDPGEHQVRVPDKAFTYERCADRGKVMVDERDRRHDTADRWMGVSESQFAIDNAVVPFKFRDRVRRSVTMAFYPGAIGFASSDEKAFVAQIERVRLTKAGKGATVHLEALGGDPADLYREASGDTKIDRVELEIDIETKSTGFGYADIPGVATGCLTASISVKAVAEGVRGRALCVASQPNGAGAAILKQTFYGGGVGASTPGASFDIGLYGGISTAGWILDTLGWDTCVGVGFSGHAVLGGGVEIGTCTAGEVETVYATAFAGGGGEVEVGANVTRSFTEQVACFGTSLGKVLDGKCAPPDREKPKKPQDPPKAPKPQPEPITEEDLGSAHLPSDTCPSVAGGSADVVLQGGAWSDPGGPVADGMPPQSVETTDSLIADLDGDHIADGAIIATCIPGGSAVFSWVYVMRAATRRAEPIDFAASVESDWELRVFDIEEIDGALLVRYSGAPYGEAHCCRMSDYEERLRWSDGDLVSELITPTNPETESVLLVQALASQEDTTTIERLATPEVAQRLAELTDSEGFGADAPLCSLSSEDPQLVDCYLTTSDGWTIVVTWERVDDFAFRASSYHDLGGGQ